MKSEVYTVFDNIALEGAPLFHAKNDAVAQRNVAVLLQQQVRPEDYSLVHIGRFDHERLVFELLDPPDVIPVAVIKRVEVNRE